MNLKAITQGWVIVNTQTSFVSEYSFQRTRKASIDKFMSLWDKEKCSWRKFKAQGYKCVKARQVTHTM